MRQGDERMIFNHYFSWESAALMRALRYSPADWRVVPTILGWKIVKKTKAQKKLWRQANVRG
jgi:hypothetical protein